MREPDETPLVIVEGFFDCMRLWQQGLRRVSGSCPYGYRWEKKKLVIHPDEAPIRKRAYPGIA